MKTILLLPALLAAASAANSLLVTPSFPFYHSPYVYGGYHPGAFPGYAVYPYGFPVLKKAEESKQEEPEAEEAASRKKREASFPYALYLRGFPYAHPHAFPYAHPYSAIEIEAPTVQVKKIGNAVYPYAGYPYAAYPFGFLPYDPPYYRADEKEEEEEEATEEVAVEEGSRRKRDTFYTYPQFFPFAQYPHTFVRSQLSDVKAKRYPVFQTAYPHYPIGFLPHAAPYYRIAKKEEDAPAMKAEEEEAEGPAAAEESRRRRRSPVYGYPFAHPLVYSAPIVRHVVKPVEVEHKYKTVTVEKDEAAKTPAATTLAELMEKEKAFKTLHFPYAAPYPLGHGLIKIRSE